MIILGVGKCSYRITLSRSEVNSLSAVTDFDVTKISIILPRYYKNVSNVLKNVQELDSGVAIYHSRIYRKGLFGIIDLLVFMASLSTIEN